LNEKALKAKDHRTWWKLDEQIAAIDREYARLIELEMELPEMTGSN